MNKRRFSISVILAVAVAATLLAVPALADPLALLKTPGLTVLEVTETTVTLRVTAGATYGTPNGFTVQWIAVPGGGPGVWPEKGFDQAIFCGQTVTDSPFVLPPGEYVDVVIGEQDDRPEVVYVPLTASGALRTGTQYVFRVFANGLGGAYQQSPYSDKVYATTSGTAPPPAPPSPPHGKPGDPGDQQKPDWPVQQREHTRRGKGFWKNHPGEWPDVPGVDFDDFFGTGLSWAQVLNTPPAGGDTYFMLAHKYIAAKLNVLAGHVPPQAVIDALEEAEEYFAEAEPGVPANTPEGKANLALAAILACWCGVEDGPGGLHYPDAAGCQGAGIGNQGQGGPPPGVGPQATAGAARSLAGRGLAGDQRRSSNAKNHSK